MEKENKKLREKYEKAERKRLFDLSNRAYELDPRVKAEVEKEDAILAEKAKDKDAAKLYRETVKILIVLATSRMPSH